MLDSNMEKMCECGVLTERECQCVFFDGEPWVDIDETTPIEWEPDSDEPEWGEVPLDTERV